MKQHTFYGSTTVGEKGQVVIPIEAREKMNLAKGTKLLAFGSSEDMLVLAKPEIIDRFTSLLSDLNRTLSEDNTTSETN